MQRIVKRVNPPVKMAPESPAEGDSADSFPRVNDLNNFLVEAKILFQEKWDSAEIPHAQMSDFDRFKTIGEGAFGKVMLVRYNPTNTFCAMKILDKASLVKSKQVEHAYNELKALISVRFPFVVSMLYCMKDNSYIYFVLPFIVGGEMFGHLKKLGRFTEEQARFYAVQVCLALEYLHYLDVIHRDLKPENIMIDYRGYIKLVDLGFCKIVKGRTYTFCGTPEYIAPEIILTKPYGKAVDWWAYGVLLYEMNAGYPPFAAHESIKIYNKILSGKYKCLHDFSYDLQDLISHLLEADLTKRFGNLVNGVEDIKKHRWFKNVNWLNILNCRMDAPFVPSYKNEGDTSNFGPVKTSVLSITSIDKYAETFSRF